MAIRVTGIEDFSLLDAYWSTWWPGQALDLFGDALLEDTRIRLEDDETAPSGKAWRPWSPAYAATRGPEHKLLFNTGDLSRSLAYDRRGRVLDFGSPLEYALVHQTGSRDGRIPEREYAGISRTLEAALQDIWASDFEKGWARARS